MATLKAREILTNLGNKGFEKDVSRDHIWLNYMSPDGKKTVIRTKLSHGKDEIGDALIGAMSKQVKLKKADFIKLVSCTLSGDEYFQMIKNQM